MLRKLIKHEFKATYKMFLILYSALLVLTLLTKITTKLPSGNTFFMFGKTLTIGMYVMVIIFLTLLSSVILVVRYFNNMYMDQGYLTHTLPVKAWHLIVSKLITYSVWMMTSCVAMVLSLVIMFCDTEMFKDIMEVLGIIFDGVVDEPGMIPLIILGMFSMILQVPGDLLKLFASMSIGQLCRKHKVIGSIGAYFIINYILNMAMTVAMYFMPAFVNMMDEVDRKLTYAKNASEVLGVISLPAYIYLGLVILVQLVLGTVFFVFSERITTKKLNLD